MFRDTSKASIFTAEPNFSSLTPVFQRVAPSDFHQNIVKFHEEFPRCASDISVFPNYADFDCWAMEDWSAGFVVKPDFELANVFSRCAGNGSRGVMFAQSYYDYLHLNCFEGPLERFYSSHGFNGLRREKNWYDCCGPQVVYMTWEKK